MEASRCQNNIYLNLKNHCPVFSLLCYIYVALFMEQTDQRSQKPKNPIKEIVFSISFGKEIDPEKMNAFLHDPEIDDYFTRTIPAGKNRGFSDREKPSPEPRPMDNLILVRDKENVEIFRMKRGSLSYHIIDQYKAYPDLLDKLEFLWSVFLRIIGSVEVSQVSVRYINQITIPSGEDYTSYTTVSVNTPFDSVSTQLVHLKLDKLSSEGNTSANITMAVKKNKDLILDIIVNKSIENQIFKKISEAFSDLRSEKNKVFQSMITDQTKQKYEL